jgi:threonine dehydratase
VTQYLPITIEDVHQAAERIRPHLSPSPLREYAPLDRAVGLGIRVAVKHENHQPTNAFKVRNGVNAVASLDADTRRRGVVAATRGNHGLGLAWAGQRLGAPVTVVVPHGNNPEKNAALRGLGAELIEEGSDYDDAVAVADRLVRDAGLTPIHSTNHPGVLAGAGTAALELLAQAPDLDALIVAVGGGSLAVGALTVARALKPTLEVYGVQAVGAAAMHEAVLTGQPRTWPRAATFADGIATRGAYELAWPALRAGLSGFITVTDGEIATALRIVLSTTHQLVEGAGAAGLAGLMKLRERLAERRVAVVLSGGNIDLRTLRAVVNDEIR